MAIEVILSEEELISGLRHVHRVRENKKQYEVTDRKFDKGNTSYSVNLMGRLGEVACGRILGLPLDETITPSGDSGHDLVTPLGKNIQVKTSTLSQLIFNSKELFVSDVAVLVRFHGDKQFPHVDGKFELLGWIDRETFLDKHYNHDYGYGLRLVMDANHLKPIEELINEVSRVF